MWGEIIQAISLGFLYGIGPCTISCAPLVVPLIMSTAKNTKNGIWLSLVFSFGRVLSYMLLGALTGLLGYVLTQLVSKKILGIFLIIIGILLFFKIQNKCILKSKIKITSFSLAIGTGFVYGLAPCQPLIALLGLTAASGSAITGLLMGIAFGIGTIISPIIILGFFSGWFAKQKEFREVIPYVSGIFLIIIGLIYVFSK
ncbi:MAG: sulfite exporter TauE/SafE family protein [Nanobdellota archaeon]